MWKLFLVLVNNTESNVPGTCNNHDFEAIQTGSPNFDYTVKFRYYDHLKLGHFTF